MTVDQHLAWLLYLMSENPEGWKQHCWHRAKELAKDPEFADLPQLLTDALRSSATTPCAPSKPPPAQPPEKTASR